jgi:DNA-binding NarL/FixJ family response regulator
LIADDHYLVAELCRRLLETEFDVVGVVSDGRALVRSAGELKPDVIVLDIAMPVLNGLDAGQQIKKMLPTVKLIYLTMNPDPDVAAEAFVRGAPGYLLKTCAAAEIVLAVHQVLRGKTYLSKALSRDTIIGLIKLGTSEANPTVWKTLNPAWPIRRRAFTQNIRTRDTMNGKRR